MHGSRGRAGERERESQIDSVLKAEPNMGPISQAWYHDKNHGQNHLTDWATQASLDVVSYLEQINIVADK